MIRIKTITLVLQLLISSQLLSQSNLQDGYYSIKRDELFQSLKFLASDSLKGRASGTIENEIAARFIAEKFREYGLIPLGNNQDGISQIRSRKKIKSSLYQMIISKNLA